MNDHALFSDGFITGVNYWALKNATRMWEDFDAEEVDRDLAALEEAGVTHLRVFPMWPVFQPLTALYTTSLTPFEYSFGNDPLPDTEAGRAGVSEEACRRFETFCDLVEKHGMKQVVGLITGHMSFGEFLPPAFQGKHRLSDPTVLKWQLRFVKYFVKRFKDRVSIVGWDLGNEVNNMAHEPECSPDEFYVWCSAIADAARSQDSVHPIVSGFGGTFLRPHQSHINAELVRDLCDVHTVHPYHIFGTQTDPLPSMKPVLDVAFGNVICEELTGVPTFVQEFGAIGYLNCSEKTEAEFYRACLYSALAHGCRGVMWWCAYDQGQLRFPPYNWNNIGSDYGLMDKNRRPKPIVDVNLAFRRDVLSRLPGRTLPASEKHGLILVPRDNGDAEPEKLRAAWMLAKRAGMNAGFADALEKIPDAPLYVLPSLASNQSIPANRLDELMEKVEEGSVLYLSLGNALFRRVTELTGLQAAWREVQTREKVMDFRGAKLPITSPVSYTIESADCEVLARDENGEPVFARKKHGKGWVYCSLLPVESSVAERPGAFYREKEPDYTAIYRELAAASGLRNRVEVTDPFVLTTEHPVDAESAYVTLINYHFALRTVCVRVNGGRLERISGAELKDGALTLERNDGAVYLWHRSENASV